MSLLKYNPFEVEDFPSGMRLFQDTVNRMLSETASRPWVPAVDIVETENEVILKADVPDVKLEDIDIRMENGTLTIRGERKLEKDDTQKGFRRIERPYGAFARYFELPDSVDPEKVNADYKNGVLTVTLPKKELAKPKSIRVQVNN